MLETHDLSTKERMEIAAWIPSAAEAGQPASEVGNLVNKLTDAPVFLEAFARHRDRFQAAGTILELGAGEGWAACLTQRLVPAGTRVIATDISPHALAGLPQWERVFQSRLDDSFACRSYAIPLPDASVDLVYAFQAAHHFVAHRRTFIELARVLRPGGGALYLHEPTCAEWIHPLAHRRVNGKGMPVPEDVLVPSRLATVAAAAGLRMRTVFDLSLAKRGPVETLYYAALRAVPPLRHLLPCTRDLVFERASSRYARSTRQL